MQKGGAVVATEAPVGRRGESVANLSLRQVSKRFGHVEVIRDLSLEIPAGEFAVFLGPSGCGKSTLLRMVAGLEVPSAGEIGRASCRERV